MRQKGTSVKKEAASAAMFNTLRVRAHRSLSR
jgi:hypothetical protein